MGLSPLELPSSQLDGGIPNGEYRVIEKANAILGFA